MKLQIASLVLAERRYLTFKVHLHDDIRDKLVSLGGDQKAYLRDRIQRQLRDYFPTGDAPMFFFVIEDRSKTGKQTRAHVHGSIEVKRLGHKNVSERKAQLKVRRISKAQGDAEAEFEAGRWAVRSALEAAAGLRGYLPHKSAAGVSQVRNVWTRKPYVGLVNANWVTYVFKNVKSDSPVLQENRSVITYKLLGEARNLWGIIRG